MEDGGGGGVGWSVVMHAAAAASGIVGRSLSSRRRRRRRTQQSDRQSASQLSIQQAADVSSFFRGLLFLSWAFSMAQKNTKLSSQTQMCSEAVMVAVAKLNKKKRTLDRFQNEIIFQYLVKLKLD